VRPCSLLSASTSGAVVLKKFYGWDFKTSAIDVHLKFVGKFWIRYCYCKLWAPLRVFPFSTLDFNNLRLNKLFLTIKICLLNVATVLY